MKKNGNYLAGAILLAAITAGSSPSAVAMGERERSPDSVVAEAAPYDVQYLDTMVKHHSDGIAMFELAATRAHREEVRLKAQMMAKEQRREIPELEALSEEIGPHTPQAVNMKLPGMEKMDMEPLRSASGLQFDRRFLEMTIRHHEGALRMSNDALKRAGSGKVRMRAGAIVKKQTAEIDELQKLLARIR